MNLLTIALQHKQNPMSVEQIRAAVQSRDDALVAKDPKINEGAYDRVEMRAFVRDYCAPQTADEMRAMIDCFLFAYADFPPYHACSCFLFCSERFESAREFIESVLTFNLYENDDVKPVELAVECKFLDRDVLDDYIRYCDDNNDDN